MHGSVLNITNKKYMNQDMNWRLYIENWNDHSSAARVAVRKEAAGCRSARWVVGGRLDGEWITDAGRACLWN
jgi:hypothetical protein